MDADGRQGKSNWEKATYRTLRRVANSGVRGLGILGMSLLSAGVSVSALASVTGLAGDAVPAKVLTPETMTPARHSVLALSNHHRLMAALQAVVAQQSSDTSPQYFYITPYSPQDMVAYVAWPQQKRLWIVPVSEHPDYAWHEVIHPQARPGLHLQGDVVATHAEIGARTDVVDRTWAAEKLFEAVVEGEKIMVPPPIHD